VEKNAAFGVFVFVSGEAAGQAADAFVREAGLYTAGILTGEPSGELLFALYPHQTVTVGYIAAVPPDETAGAAGIFGRIDSPPFPLLIIQAFSTFCTTTLRQRFFTLSGGQPVNRAEENPVSIVFFKRINRVIHIFIMMSSNFYDN
jgi:hypothetical protein